jgi:4-carboxymuconolactone decarboxylase
VHFGQLFALGHEEPAQLHIRAARRAGKSIEELLGVAELVLITVGMPAYSLGVRIIGQLVDEHDGEDPRGG